MQAASVQPPSTRSMSLSLLAATFTFPAVMVTFSPTVALVMEVALAIPTASWNLKLSSWVRSLSVEVGVAGGAAARVDVGFALGAIVRSRLEVMFRFSVRVLETSAVRLKFSPAVI